MESAKKSRAARRRDAKRQTERDRQRQREEEAKAAADAAGGTPKELEVAAIEKQLAPLGLELREVSADGHCLFRAVAHQLRLRDPDTTLNHAALRRIAVEHVEANRTEYEPFVAADGQDFAGYCQKMKSTAEWGGQLEVRALSEALKTPVYVLSAHSAMLKTGEEYGGDPIYLCHHRYYLTLGEHYNSVRSR